MGLAPFFLWIVFSFAKEIVSIPTARSTVCCFLLFFSILRCGVPSFHGVHRNSIRPPSSCSFADVSCSSLLLHAPVGSFAAPCRPSCRPAPRLRTSWLGWTTSCLLPPRTHRFRWPAPAATSSSNLHVHVRQRAKHVPIHRHTSHNPQDTTWREKTAKGRVGDEQPEVGRRMGMQPTNGKATWTLGGRKGSG